MDENTYFSFYKNTVLSYSKSIQYQIIKQLEAKRLISFSDQRTLEDSQEILFFDNKNDFENIITRTTAIPCNAKFYETLEYTKLYKYSVPFFYTTATDSIRNVLVDAKVQEFIEEDYNPTYILNSSISDTDPMFWEKDGDFFIKFVTQRSYIRPSDDFEQVDYRYVVVIYINPKNNILEIRYDSVKYQNQPGMDFYERTVSFCIEWIKRKLGFYLYLCDHACAIDAVKNKDNSEIVMYKQMMQLVNGGSAELTASESRDYVLPFVGEIRELIEENEELFDKAEEIKNLILRYLDDKEDTANYTYIYIKWVKPVESQSYVVKLTFDYLNQTYTLMQHITGSCKDLGMGRMNEAIKYLCRIKAFVRGEEI